MKSPRELLLEKHLKTTPALDAVRRRAMETLFVQEEPKPRLLWKVWLELIMPYRRAWTGLAAIWLVVLGFSIASLDGSQPVYAQSKAPTRETIMVMREQMRELAELVKLVKNDEFVEPVEPTEPVRKSEPPRSELKRKIMVG
jgi:hypothetical protein